MALINPPLEVIKRSKVQPTAGEWTMLNFLTTTLDNSYEIFFQPFLNGDNPDFVILRKNCGVLIIEVKDWNLNHYELDAGTDWILKSDKYCIKSPYKQVEEYKRNFYELHIDNLYTKNIYNPKNWAIIGCVVYFHNASTGFLNNFLFSQFQSEKYTKYRSHMMNFGSLCRDNLNKSSFQQLLQKFRLDVNSYYFDETLYNSFHRHLQAPFHKLEEGIFIEYSPAQKELIRSEIRPRRKIKGVAGSGKTFVLAKRAVNAYLRTQNAVLILTFNIALVNYIRDRISDVRENFPRGNFHIVNYHQFFRAQANNLNLKIGNYKDWEDKAFFSRVKEQTPRYSAVFIDEIQDYEQEWIDIIITYFTEQESTELVVFGDEKQNIYSRKMDENKEPVVRGIPGAWNKSMNTPFRFTGDIVDLVLNFQHDFFEKKYNIDEITKLIEPEISFESKKIRYLNLKTFNDKELIDLIYKFIELGQIHSSDCAILASKVDLLRGLDYQIRSSIHEKTTTTFESKEEYDRILENIEEQIKKNPFKSGKSKNELIDDLLEKLRRSKKLHFNMGTGTIKLSTVHSFKGWEIHTIFLIIEKEIENDRNDSIELVYTGLTRSRKNIVIINHNDPVYHEFFTKQIELGNLEYL